jgi:hypothetical protein
MRELQPSKTLLGTPLKEMYFEDKTSKDHILILEAIYYTRL